MNLILRVLFITFALFYYTQSYAENLIAFIDMNKIMNESTAGKSITSQLEKLHKKNIDYFTKEEKKLKEKESSIISQKNVLSKDEFEKKIISLRDEANSYRSKRTELIDSLTKKRVNATNDLIKAVHPILLEYSTTNSISIVIQKKNIIIGKNELDITNDIMSILNKKIKKVDLK